MKLRPAANAFREGFDARLHSAEAVPCPYEDERASDWLDGWAAANEQLTPKPPEKRVVLEGQGAV